MVIVVDTLSLMILLAIGDIKQLKKIINKKNMVNNNKIVRKK